jgi:guanine deaminase
MCLGAVLWSDLDSVYFAAGRDDAAAAGFDDARMYAALTGAGGDVTPPLVRIRLASCTVPFDAWSANPDRIPY